jgi:hypothetical protein
MNYHELNSELGIVQIIKCYVTRHLCYNKKVEDSSNGVFVRQHDRMGGTNKEVPHPCIQTTAVSQPRCTLVIPDAGQNATPGDIEVLSLFDGLEGHYV